MQQRTLKSILLTCLLFIRFPHPSSGQQTTPNPLQQLTVLEDSLSTSWRKNDLPNFRSTSTASLAVAIPTAVLRIGAEVTSALGSLGKALSVLSPIFSILSIVADTIGLTVFSQDRQFAELYGYLQDNFVKVNAMIEPNFHAIKDLQSVVKCDQALSQVNQYKTKINGCFNRFLVMMKRAQTDREGALAVFDTELSQYQSTMTLLELQQLLLDSRLIASILTNCARGSAQDFLRMMVELHHTFKQAIILDNVAKIRLHNNTITKQALNTDRVYWKKEVTRVANLMAQTASNLVNESWFNFYHKDIGSSLSSSSSDTASNAAGSLSNFLTLKYPYVRTAVIIAPWDSMSISITDAFGSAMRTVSKDSFICYNSKRANGEGKLEPVIVLCRNAIAYPTEQAELDSAYATYSRGVLSLSLVDALRNNHWDDISSIMKEKSVSFFAVKVEIRLSSGSVSTAQSAAAADLVFFDRGGTAFQALVIAKLIRAAPEPKVANSIVPPRKVNAASSICAQLPVVGVTAAIVFTAAWLHHLYGIYT